MPLAKGAIAAIVIVVLAVVGVSIWAGITYGPKKKSQKYSCTNKTCTADDNGQYDSEQACNSACGGAVVSATGFNCIPDTYTCQAPTGNTSGQYAKIADCKAACVAPRFSCDTSNWSCSQTNDPAAPYTSKQECQAACIDPNPPVKYACDSTTHTCSASTGPDAKYTLKSVCQSECQAAAPRFSCDTSTWSCSQTNDPAAPYTSKQDCQAACIKPQTVTFNCDGVKGCSSVQDNTGRYPDQNTCDAACKKLKCDSSGSCATASDTFVDLTDCNKACANQVYTYNCESDKGCVKIPGNTGRYPDSGTCQDVCLAQKCDPSAGTCTATSDSYMDQTDCKNACTKQVYTFNCDGSKGCTQIPGSSGRYPNSEACQAACQKKKCSGGSCSADSDTFIDVNDCAASCSTVGGCSTYRPSNAQLSPGVDWQLGSFTDAMSQTYSYPFTGVRITYEDPKNSNTVVNNSRMMAYVGDWVDSGAQLFSQWANTYGISPQYSIVGTPDVPFLYVPQLGTTANITNLGNKGLYFDPTKSYAQDARTLNNIPGILIENLSSGRSYRVYMGQPPSMQASERFADNHFGYHNPAAGDNLRNTFYWNFRGRTDNLPMETVYVSASTDLFNSYHDPTSKTCFYYDANILSTKALSSKLWPHGPASSVDCLYVDFTDSYPLNGQLGVISGAGFQAKGMDLPNKMGPQVPSLVIKPNVNVGNGLTKNVCELRTYIAWDGHNSTFKVVTSGGLITSKKWASGRYEIRAKVGNRPGMVWAIWTFTAVYKLPSPMANCQTDCSACVNCSDYSTCCSLCSTATGTKCGNCGGPGGAACSEDSDCSGSHCVIAANPAQCNCNQCQANQIPEFAQCSGYDCSQSVACSWDTSKKVCVGSDACSKFTTQDSCNNSGPCQGTLSWKNAAAPVGIPTPWGAAEVPQNIYYVGTADIVDPASAGPNYKTEVAGAADAGALLGGLPCSSYYNMEIDFCEIPSNAPFYSEAPPPAPDTVRPTAHTANLNSYRFTNSAGTGSYTNYYVEAQAQSNGKKQPFIGDGCYHTYAYEWHTGDPAKNIRPKVDAFFDGDYIGTTDSFVSDVFSRLWIVSWNSSNAHWNGSLGTNSTVWSDVTELPTTTVASQSGTSLYSVNYIDYISITPFNEANDKFTVDPLDQPNMNELMDPRRVGVDPNTGEVLPGGSGYKQPTCCALVKQPNPYDGTVQVDMCTDFAYHSVTSKGIDWTNPTLLCGAPLNGDKVAPLIQTQAFVPFFQTKTAITTQDGLQGYGVIYSASQDELNGGGGGGGGGGGCAGANVPCTSDDVCTAYLKAQNCPSSCYGYCRPDNKYCSFHC